MKLILRVHSSNEWDTGDCEFALVHLTPHLAKIALSRIAALEKVRKRDSLINSMRFWDYSCTFFPWLESFEELDEVELYNNDLLEVESFELPEDKEQSTECDMMKVYDDRICWTAIPKHSTIDVTTATISKETLMKVRFGTLNPFQRRLWRLREIIAEMQAA